MLEVSGLCKRYDRVVALDHLDLTAREGRLLGFLGANGAGKTTTMRAVFGLVTPDAGTVHWHGDPIDDATRRRFGYMPEQRGLYPKMGVADQLVYLGRIHGMRRTAATRSALALLDELGLGDRAGAALESLSHGNQQRVQLAAALVHEPDLLVLDEPFSGLDPIGVGALLDVLRRRAAAGAAIVFSSHQLDLVEWLCDDVAIIHRGAALAHGPLDAVRERAGVRIVDVTFAAPTAWVPQGSQVVETRANGVRATVPAGTDPSAVLAAASAAGAVVAFTFRPPALLEVFRDTVAATDSRPGPEPTPTDTPVAA